VRPPYLALLLLGAVLGSWAWQVPAFGAIFWPLVLTLSIWLWADYFRSAARRRRRGHHRRSHG